MVEVLKRGAAHESLVCTSAYILGEYGKSIAGVGALPRAMPGLKLSWMISLAALDGTVGVWRAPACGD